TDQQYLPAFSYILALVFIALFLLFAMRFLYREITSNWWLVALAADLILIRLLMVGFEFPSVYYNSDFFGPDYFAFSGWLPSLGDLFLNALFILFFSILFKRRFFVPAILDNTRSGKRLFGLIAGIAASAVFLLSCFLIKNLVLHSSLPFNVYKISELNFYSFIGYITMALLIAAFLFITDLLIRLVSSRLNIRDFLVFFILPAIILQVATGLPQAELLPATFFLVIINIIAFIRYRFDNYSYAGLVLLLLVISLFVTTIVLENSLKKEYDDRKIHALNLANERDPVAELLMGDMGARIQEDRTIHNYMFRNFSGISASGNAQSENTFVLFLDEVLNYMQKKYFVGFWNKYELRIFLCSSSEQFPEGNRLNSCESYFNNIIKEQGIAVPGTNFFYMDNHNGRISYFGSVGEYSSHDSVEAKLYLQLDSKLITQELGYPELLLEKHMSGKASLSGYSYAKFNDGELVTQNGDYHYSLKNSVYGFNEEEEFSYVDYDGYNHLQFRIDNQNTVVVSRPVIDWMDRLISFSYIFVFLYVLLNASLIFQKNPLKNKIFRRDFKTRVQISMISVLLLSLVLIGFGTVYYNIKQYKNKQHDAAVEKIQSVLIELTHKLGEEQRLTAGMQEYLTNLLLKFSNVFYSDINLYDLKGRLLASSRQEIFEKGLIGSRMNAVAYRELKINKKAQFIHTENIGKLEYLSVYVPFSNNENKPLAYLNLPYFSKQTELTREITALVVTIINIYLILFLLTISVAVIITNRLTHPLRLIQQNFREVELGKKNEPIRYRSSDEIGSLVKEYNRMLEELNESAVLPAKSERESAWREMAKQIAHEIKNPLTPMKLSVQHLLRSWHDRVPDWEKRLEKVTTTLIENIDSLSAIAAEFSSFAKMPGPANEVVNIIEKIRNSISLFEDMQNIRFVTDLPDRDEVKIYADKEQILRVFNNLIKNAIQAIPSGKNGLITISLQENVDTVIVAVQDNGTGISDELKESLFIPNFTTKTSGMGLGLAMVKNIVEGAGGNIWFDTETGRGSTFYVEFPLINDQI
ncbi:MAG: GHKL domain-containing protein, partial [Bacteroidetes bacterium]|nr:GHKL domain-containing protein [Bacteroidota bacterium]